MLPRDTIEIANVEADDADQILRLNGCLPEVNERYNALVLIHCEAAEARLVFVNALRVIAHIRRQRVRLGNRGAHVSMYVEHLAGKDGHDQPWVREVFL